ncbi:hypothetical protein NESM_000477500 [Novymonas esmeraldas]|uniref:Uncharacterized protein n=1 Tax=Novymonas esmeraldas TaxID=1808958 RepID=A0AAW0EQ39_9TRYP
MRRLIPSAAHGVLTDEAYEQCLRHYATCASSTRGWTTGGDVALRLVWDSEARVAPQSPPLASSSAAHGDPALPPATPRYRDKFVTLPSASSPTSLSSAAGVAAAAVDPVAPPVVGEGKATEYTLISDEDDDEPEGNCVGTPSLSSSPSVSQRSRRGGAPVFGKPRAVSSSPAPARSGRGRGGVSRCISPAPHPSQRQSTGSSVVIVSQPTRKTTERGGTNTAVAPQRRLSKSAPSSSSSSRGGDPDVDGGHTAGTKRQRSMEEFLYHAE